MGIIALLIFGLLAGLIARAILPGKQPGGWLTALICGVLGSVVVGWLASVLMGKDVIKEFFDLGTWIAGIIGAILVTLIWQTIVRRRA